MTLIFPAFTETWPMIFPALRIATTSPRELKIGLPLAPPAALLARRQGCKLLVDFAEYGLNYTLGGIGASRAYVEAHPDIAFVDISMPGFDGLTFIRRASSIAPHIHLIVLSMSV